MDKKLQALFALTALVALSMNASAFTVSQTCNRLELSHLQDERVADRQSQEAQQGSRGIHDCKIATGDISELAPGGVTTYSCVAWLCAYATAHQDEEHDLPGDNPVTKMTGGGAITQGTFAGSADITTSLGSGTCNFRANGGCGYTWSEVDFTCSGVNFFAETTASDLLLTTPPARAHDPICN